MGRCYTRLILYTSLKAIQKIFERIMTNITKSRSIQGAYYINTKGILIENWEFHKQGGYFTNEEVEAFDNYLKSSE